MVSFVHPVCRRKADCWVSYKHNVGYADPSQRAGLVGLVQPAEEGHCRSKDSMPIDGHVLTEDAASESLSKVSLSLNSTSSPLVISFEGEVR